MGYANKVVVVAIGDSAQMSRSGSHIISPVLVSYTLIQINNPPLPDGFALTMFPLVEPFQWVDRGTSWLGRQWR